jgi:hypothetical protein
MGEADVFPGSGESIAISRRCPGRSPAYEGVAVFDNGVKRPDEPADALSRDSIALSGDATVLFGYEAHITTGALTRDAVSASGLSLEAYKPDGIDDFNFGIKWDSGMVYGSDGRVVQPTTLDTVGRYDLRRGNYHPIGRVEPDSINNRVYFITTEFTYGYDFQVFDLQTRSLLGVIPIPLASGSATDIIRWGSHGIAFATDSGQLVLMQSMLIAGPVNSDDDRDGMVDTLESACGSDAFSAPSSPERIDTPGDDDGDTFVNEGLPAGAGAFDCDGDGYMGSVEGGATTSDQDPCGASGWPSDIVSTDASANRLDLQDLGSFVAPVRRLGTSPGHPRFGARWDLVPGSVVGPAINVQDIGALFTGASGYPPMLGGQRAFGLTCPFAP